LSLKTQHILFKFFDADKHKNKFKEELGVSPDTILIGIVGRLVPIKNHRMFLDAAKIVCKRAGLEPAPTKFIIVGDGELRQELENYARQIGIQDSVIFTGWRRDLEKIYAGLDIVCLTSLNEGTPVSLIEAMAAAKPVISTDVGGVKDIVEHEKNGLLVASGNIDEYADAVIKLIKNPDMRLNMGAYGRESVREKFSKDRLIEDMKKLYTKLLKERGII